MDYYHKSNFNVCFDKPILFFDKKNQVNLKINKRSKFLIPWPQFGPQSCKAIKKKYLLKIWKKIAINKFQDIWLELRT